jgi:hypothetical protein
VEMTNALANADATSVTSPITEVKDETCLPWGNSTGLLAEVSSPLPHETSNGDGSFFAKYGLLLPGEVDALCAREETSGRSGIIAGLIAPRSVSMLVGDSGIGKSPLAYQLSLCVAGGIPFIGRTVQQGTVVYADYENSLDQSKGMREQILRLLELPKAPDRFMVWTGDSGSSLQIEEICHDVRPVLLIIDSLRAHNPHFEKTDNAGEEMKRLNTLCRKYGVGILAIHHTRKPKMDQGVPSLDNENTPLMLWLKETAGHGSIINQSHTRIAVGVPDLRKSHSQDAALVVRWHRRVQGEVGPIYLERVCDENGEPLGYRPLRDVRLLGNAEQEAAFAKLPPQFTFREAKQAYGRADDPTRKWLVKCAAIGLVRQASRGRYSRTGSGDGGDT